MSLIDGLAGSEALDTSGERLSVPGCDITDYQRKKATLVYEHRSGAKGNARDVVGRVIYGKKLFREEDCENDRQKYFWGKCKMPCIYVVCRLRDSEGNQDAVALMAELRAAKKHDEPMILGFSVEGKTIDQVGHQLKSTVCRDLAATYKPANRTAAGAEILQDDQDLVGAAMTKSEIDDLLDGVADLEKAYEAGGGDVAPGHAVQGAALEKKAKPQDAPLPEAKGGRIRVMSDGKRGGQQVSSASAPLVVSPAAGALTVRGQAVQPNPDLVEPRFDEEHGVLHLPEGSLQAYLPEHDRTGDQFEQLLNDPRASQVHDRAMEGWTRAHRLLKERRLPGEVVMHSVLHSEMSPNTSVPQQEHMFSKLVDSMRHTGHDPRTPGFESTIDHWQTLNRPDVLPEHARGYFEGHRGVHTAEGKVRGYNFPEQKADNVLKYHLLHDSLMQLLKQHGHDSRKVANILMAHKMASENHASRRKNAVAGGRPDPGPYLQGHLSVPGLAPKTSRYALAMMGGGNVQVPDTHFVRHFYGLEKGKDTDTIEEIKRHLWNPKNSHVLEGMDRWYAKHHPAVQHMINHPRWGKEFQNPEDAIFPAFWKHWMTIVPHERLRGMRTGGSNELTSHLPFWEAVDPFTKSEEMSELPLRTALVHQAYVRHLGEVPASMLYATFLLPRLLDGAEHRLHEAAADHLLAGAAPRLERHAAELRSFATPASHGVPDQAELFPGAQVRKVGVKDGPAAGRFLLLHGNVHHLEDYHGILSRLLPEGPLDSGGVARLHALEASPHLTFGLDHVLPSAQAQATPSEEPAQHQPEDPGPSMPPPAETEAYRYRRAGQEKDVTIEVTGDQAYVDGVPVPSSFVELMMHNVERGIATLTPAALQKGEGDDLAKAQLTPMQVVQHLRDQVAAGTLPQEVADSATAHLYHDPMNSEHRIGNRLAWREFDQQKRPGVYVGMDATDFKAINDTYGHHVGDQAIQAMGGALRGAHDEAVGRGPGAGKLFRPGASGMNHDPSAADVWRPGGDEFHAYFPSHEHAVRFLDAARKKLADLPPVGGTHRISMGFGLGHTPEVADAAVYEAKKGKYTAGGQRAHVPGQAPNMAYSLVPGKEGPIHLAPQAPPSPHPAPPPANPPEPQAQG